MWGPMICLICRSYLNHKLIKVRGGVTKKKPENLGKIPKGGGIKKNRRKFPISIWEFDKPRGGLNFSKMSEFQLFDSVVCNITFIRNV